MASAVAYVVGRRSYLLGSGDAGGASAGSKENDLEYRPSYLATRRRRAATLRRRYVADWLARLGGGRVMSRATEPFGRIPNRLLADVAAGELTPHGLLLLVYFEGTSNRFGNETVWTGTTQRIEDELRWPFKRRQLLGELATLRADGYIDGGPAPRSRSPFQVRLRRARADGGHGVGCACDACLGFV